MWLTCIAKDLNSAKGGKGKGLTRPHLGQGEVITGRLMDMVLDNWEVRTNIKLIQINENSTFERVENRNEWKIRIS